MALHVPTQHPSHSGLHVAVHLGAEGRQTIHDLSVALVLALATGAVVWMGMALRTGVPDWLTTRPDMSQVEFRAAERDDLAAGRTTQGTSLIEFRAMERASQ